jgi:hypothetical protein
MYVVVSIDPAIKTTPFTIHRTVHPKMQDAIQRVLQFVFVGI